MQGVGDRQCTVAPDADQGIDFHFPEMRNDLVTAIKLLHAAVRHGGSEAQRVAMLGRAQDGAAEMANATHHLGRHAKYAIGRITILSQDAVKALAYAIALSAALRSG